MKKKINLEKLDGHTPHDFPRIKQIQNETKHTKSYILNIKLSIK